MADVDIELSPSISSSLSETFSRPYEDNEHNSDSELTAHDTLRLEESEEDENELSNLGSEEENDKLVFKKKSKIVDSDGEAESNAFDQSEPVPKEKKSRILKAMDSDSSSEDETNKLRQLKKKEIQKSMAMESNSSDNESNKEPKKKKSRILKAVESVSSSDNETTKVPEPKEKRKKKSRISKKVNTDSSPDADLGYNEPKHNKTKKKSRISIASDSDSMNESNKIPNEKEVVKKIEETFQKSKFSALIDSDSISDLSDAEKDEPKMKKNKETKKSKKDSKKKNKDNGGGILASLNLNFGSDSEKSSQSGNDVSEPDECDLEMAEKGRKAMKEGSEKKERMSAKVAREQMKVIQSESQRMAREAEIRVPYHRPKQYSLKEFLNRKTINKPVVSGLKQASIKMTQEELEVYAKKLEERAKEAYEFYKNEEPASEKSQSVEQKTNENPKEQETDPSQIEIQPVDEQPMDTNPCDTLHITESEGEIAATSSDLMESLKITESEGDLHMTSVNTSDLIETQEVADSDLANIEIQNESMKDKEMEEVINKSYHADDIIASQIEKDSDTAQTKEPIIDYDFVDGKEKRKAEILAQSNVDRPSLQGGPDMFIDLDNCGVGDFTGRKQTGADILLQRFSKCTKKKHNSKTDLAILTVEHGVAHVDHYIVKVDDDEKAKTKDPIPGAAYVKLKQTLKEKIATERMKDLMKKIGVTSTNEEGGKLFQENDDIEESDMEEVERQEDEDDAEGEEEEEPIENDIVLTDNKRTKNDFLDEEAEVSGDDEVDVENGDKEDKEEEEETSSESEEEAEKDDKTIKKGRILKAFEDSDDEQEKNVMGPPPKQVLTEFDESSQPISLLWQDSETKTNNAEDDLIGLCSGSFTTQQPSTQNKLFDLASQNKLFDSATQSGVDESQLIGLCSGQFTTQIPSELSAEHSQIEPEPSNSPKNVHKGRIILESSEDETENHEVKERKMKKKLKKRRKKNLEFSDDEEDEENDEEEENEEEENGGEEIDGAVVEDEEEKYVDYDSEENEIEVVMTKNDKVKRITEFFEAEAELSDEDRGAASDDEDEKDLDRYDIELGDEDDFDQDKLQDEVGRIHMRKMLEQDKKEVQNIQDLLLEDEENDGVGRTRQFRWKNIDQSFGLDGNRDGENPDGQNGEGTDEIESEEKWRKMRFERELILQQDKEKDSSMDLSATLLNRTGDDMSFKIMNNTLGKKITIVSSIKKNSEPIIKKDSPFLISKATVTNQPSKASFLKRDAATLARLAAITRINPDDAGVSTVNAGGSGRNFVFATLSPAVRENSSKRSLNDADAEVDSHNQTKKQKKNYNKENL